VLIVRALEALLLPPLPLVATEVEHVEGAVGFAFCVELALEFYQALSRGVDGETAKVGHDPAAAEPFCDGARSAGTTKEVGDETPIGR